MFTRDTLQGELNKAAEAISALRSSESADTEALASAIVRFDAVQRELAAFDAANPAAPAAPAAAAPASLGGEAVSSGVFSRAAEFGRASATLQRDIWTGTSGGALNVVTPDVTEGIAARPRKALSVLDVIPTIPTTKDKVVVYVQTGFTNAAAGVARRSGSPANFGAYAESGIAVERQEFTIAKVGHFVRSDQDSYDDAPALEALVNTELVYGVRDVMEQHLLSPTDLANGIKSMIVTGEGRAQALGYPAAATGVQKLDAIREAKTAAELALLPADFVILNPADLEAIELSKDEAGDYLGAGPFASGSSTIWGLSVVVSHNLAAGTIVVGSTRALSLRVRRGIEVEVSTNVADDFIRDAVVIKGSARAQLANTRPEAIVVLTEDEA